MADKKPVERPAEGDVELLTEERVRASRPPRYLVVMLNDDYTPMEFVVWVLQKVFHKTGSESTRLMLEVHTKGRSVIGAFTHDVARTKIHQVHSLAEQNQHPLTCVLEVESGDDDE
jgi:ATP-dependent Clp protease adaptor protein ClpS